MSVLMTVDRNTLTKKGYLSDDEWKPELSAYIDGKMAKEIDKIGQLIINKSEDFTLLHSSAHAQVAITKNLGLMRLGMIFDTMYRAVTKDRVE